MSRINTYPPILSVTNDILIDLNGDRAYLTDDKLYVNDNNDTTVLTGYIITNESDLGEPGSDKLIDYIYFDYSGSFDITFYIGTDLLVTLTAPLATNRRVGQLYMPLRYRKPFQKLRMQISTSTQGSIMYGVEINFTTMKKRYNG